MAQQQPTPVSAEQQAAEQRRLEEEQARLEAARAEEERVKSILSQDDLLHLVDKNANPNLHPLAIRLRDINNLALNLKFYGYELARRLASELPVRAPQPARHVGLKSKPSTQADIASDWVAHWLTELKAPVVFHRKVWELAYVLQAIFENGHLKAGARGLGFGCGEEPIPSYLASHGVDVLVTDLEPTDMQAAGWVATGQNTGSLERAYRDHLVSRELFDRHVSLRYVDMNAIPDDLKDFDFCWSICAFEHIGSIQKGLDFVRNSLNSVRPGGLSVHTTEFNFTNDLETIDNWPSVLFQKAHFRQLADRLRQEGHEVAELDFDVGNDPLDKFIDIPPFAHDWQPGLKEQWDRDAAHIKVSVDGFPSTCFGVIVKKGAGASST